MPKKASKEKRETAPVVWDNGDSGESGTEFRDPPALSADTTAELRTLDDVTEELGERETPPRPLTILDDLGLAWDPVGREITDAAGDQAITVQVRRVAGYYPDGTSTPPDEYLEEGPPSRERLSRIKAIYGGGTIQFRFLNRAHKYLRQVTQNIAGPARQPTAPAAEQARDPAGAPAPGLDFDQQLERLIRIRDAFGGDRTDAVSQLLELHETYEKLAEMFASERDAPAGETVSEQVQMRLAQKAIDLGERYIEMKLRRGKERAVSTAPPAAPDASPPPPSDPPTQPTASGDSEHEPILPLIESSASSILTAFAAGLSPADVAAEISKRVHDSILPGEHVPALRRFVDSFRPGDETALRDRVLAGAGARQAGRARFKKAGAEWIRSVIEALRKEHKGGDK